LIPVVGNTHPFYGAYALVDFIKAIAGGFGLGVVLSAFILAPFLRPALVGIRRVISIAAPLAPGRGADLARVCWLSVSDKLRYSVLRLRFLYLLFFPHTNIIAQILAKAIDLSYTTSND